MAWCRRLSSCRNSGCAVSRNVGHADEDLESIHTKNGLCPHGLLLVLKKLHPLDLEFGSSSTGNYLENEDDNFSARMLGSTRLQREDANKCLIYR
ncbi:hypothetical protein J5N97_001424 [Dioscorea zingiberensis]|uniref:Uncharacterized protein n=1 Tax=Dioscorea zingiberensis TaxID=325984 RepID=A0A9D5BTV3_9LILI|nr:hypothetical protein J5N97_001424 [Dioscorea zingiberensis]